MDEGRHSRKDGDQLLSYSAMGLLRTTMFGLRGTTTKREAMHV